MIATSYRSDNRKTREYKARQLQVVPDGTAYIILDGPRGAWLDIRMSSHDIAELVRAAIIRSPTLGLLKCIAP